MKRSYLMLATGLLVVAGCEKSEAPSGQDSGSSSAAPAATLPAGLFLATQPDGATTVEDARASAKTGDPVTIRGRIGGSKSPFVEGRAVFTLMGSGLKACSDDPEDKCPTPWDYCCDNASDIAKHSATIQVVDTAGAPIRTGLRGTNGVRELSEVVVVGRVTHAEEKAFVVAASGVFIAKP